MSEEHILFVFFFLNELFFNRKIFFTSVGNSFLYNFCRLKFNVVVLLLMYLILQYSIDFKEGMNVQTTNKIHQGNILLLLFIIYYLLLQLVPRTKNIKSTVMNMRIATLYTTCRLCSRMNTSVTSMASVPNTCEIISHIYFIIIFIVLDRIFVIN